MLITILIMNEIWIINRTEIKFVNWIIRFFFLAFTFFFTDVHDLFNQKATYLKHGIMIFCGFTFNHKKIIIFNKKLKYNLCKKFQYNNIGNAEFLSSLQPSTKLFKINIEFLHAYLLLGNNCVFVFEDLQASIDDLMVGNLCCWSLVFENDKSELSPVNLQIYYNNLHSNM